MYYFQVSETGEDPSQRTLVAAGSDTLSSASSIEGSLNSENVQATTKNRPKKNAAGASNSRRNRIMSPKSAQV